MPENRITIRAMIIGGLMAGVFAFVTAYFEKRNIFVTATQIAVLPYALLFTAVAVINPLLKLVRFLRPFTVAELLIVFVMGAVSASVASFGGVTMMLSLSGSLYDRQWDTPQYKLDIHVIPFLPDDYFLGEPGIQQVAAERRVVTLEMQELTAAQRAAARLADARENVADLEGIIETLSDAATPAEIARLKKRERELLFAQRALEGAQRAWVTYAETYDADDLLATFDQQIEALRPRREDLDARYAALAEKAYVKVERFRTGLPEDMRATPGFIKDTDETLEDFAARFRRLRYGLASLAQLREADDLLAEQPADIPVSSAVASAVADHLDAASAELVAIADRDALLSRKAALDADEAALVAELQTINADLKIAQEEKRTAVGDELEAVNDRIDDLQAAKKTNAEALALARTELERMRSRMATLDAVLGLSARIDSLAQTARGPPPLASALRTKVGELVAVYPSIDASVERYLVGQVPWGQWAGVLARWGLVFGLTYLMLMGLNVLIFRQWAYHEKLIYPLAQLPEIFAGKGEVADAGHVPPIYRSGLFWAGVLISGLILGWNVFVRSAIVPDLPQIPLVAKWVDYVRGSMFGGLESYTGFELFFTVIGLSFLIPANITFSLWSFRFVAMFLLLIMVSLGYGANEKAFPDDWTITLNFLSALGGGALIVFSLVNVYRCRAYILCSLRPGAVAKLDAPEAKELRIYSLIFLLSSLLLILILWLDMGASLFLTLFVYVTILVITIGLVRVVAEGGLLGFQCWFGPFHLIRTLFGMNKAWAAPTLFAPLFIYYSMLFLDIKAFIAPTMANALKIRDDLHMPRLRFHVSVYLGILIAAVIGIFTHMTLSYDVGANSMSWFLSDFSKLTIVDNLASFARIPPVDNSNNIWWLVTGACAMVALLYLRRRFFAMPHPIGLIMLVNPLMHSYWFSIFLGWLAKKLVTKYGNNNTYERTRCLFVGLIAGELLIVVGSLILHAITGWDVRIDLNRNRSIK